MSSKELLLQHFQRALVSHNYNFDEFRQSVGQYYRGRHESEPDIATVKDWYSKYQERDEGALELAEERIHNFLSENREAQLHELEKLQLEETLSLEELVNKLYRLDQLLDRRLTYKDEALKANVLELQKFNQLLELSNSKEVDEGKDSEAIEKLGEKLTNERATDHSENLQH